MARAKAKPSTIDTVVTFLEMDSDLHVHIHPPANLKLSLMRAEAIPVHFYRYLYDKVGEGLYWIDRKKLSDDKLTAAINAEGIELFVAYVGGVPAGFFELDVSDSECVWLAYFGIIADYQGLGLGKWLLSEAISAAWAKSPNSIKVETCTLDGPRALPLYQRMGFVPYERQEKMMELP